MKPYYEDEWLTVYGRDCREVLATLPAESVHCVVTSPPYWGLRDYGVAGQLGLEPTPDEYVGNMVAVFREVRRVLRSDGTVWLNLGDSYAAGGMSNPSSKSTLDGGKNRGAATYSLSRGAPVGLKPKDLVGIPWRVAFALQQPYYTGRIANERDRAWLAAIVDGEGSICVDIARAGGGNRVRDSYSLSVRVHNTSRELVDRCKELTGLGSVRLTDGRRQPVYVWSVYAADAREILRELYPYLVAKRQQARVGYGRIDADGYGALKLLHAGRETVVDAPEPPSMFEPGWYLRSDIVWSKPNPMPESVTDRPTKSHEYLFLLSKSARYYFDADAVRGEYVKPFDNSNRSSYSPGYSGSGRVKDGPKGDAGLPLNPAGRNIRSVWTVATQPYPGAHFAVFPEALVEPCILAGTSAYGVCPHCGAPWTRSTATTRVVRTLRKGEPKAKAPGQPEQSGYRGSRLVETTGWQPSCAHVSPLRPSPAVVLDLFGGSGTVGRVAQRLSRRAVLIDLNPDYLRQQMERNRDIPLGLPA